jgi:hypothetical protein
MVVNALYSEWDLNPHNCNSQGILSPSCLPIPPSEQHGAENETRTRDPDLGKVVLYQLSYFRNCDAKISRFFDTNKTFLYFFINNYSINESQRMGRVISFRSRSVQYPVTHLH